MANVKRPKKGGLIKQPKPTKPVRSIRPGKSKPTKKR